VKQHQEALNQSTGQVHWLGWALAGTQVLLCLLLAWLWLTPQGHIKNRHWQPPAPVTTDIAALLPATGYAPPDSAAQMHRVQRALERPLFTLSRRPLPSEDPEPSEGGQEVQDQWAQAQLLGTFSGGPAGGGVIVLYEGKAQRLMQGQSLGGWTLQQVREREIELHRAGTIRTLPLTRPAQPKLAAQPLGSDPARAQRQPGNLVLQQRPARR